MPQDCLITAAPGHIEQILELGFTKNKSCRTAKALNILREPSLYLQEGYGIANRSWVSMLGSLLA